MAGFHMHQRQMPTVKVGYLLVPFGDGADRSLFKQQDFDSPHTISMINEIAYDWDDSTSERFDSSILPPFFEAFRYHLSTANIPSDDDYNIDLPLIRACFIAFAKRIPDMYGDKRLTTRLWKDILSLKKTILSWTRYFFQSFEMSISFEDSPHIGGIPDMNLSCIAPLLSTLIQNDQFRFSLYSEPNFMENVARFWVPLTLRGYQSRYGIRALIATLAFFDEKIEEMAEIVRSRHDIEDVATVVMQGFIEAQSHQPQKYIDYARSGKLLAFCTLVWDEIFDFLAARKSIMWSCRAIRTLVSKPMRYSPSEARIRIMALQHLLGVVAPHSQSYVYKFTEALDFHLLESVLTINHFISLNEGSLGAGMTPPMIFDVLVKVFDNAPTLSVYRSVLRRILRVVKHASKFESTLGQWRVSQGWHRLKALALECKKDMHQYDVEENNGHFLCQNQENAKRAIGKRFQVIACYVWRIDQDGKDLNEQAENPDPVATMIMMSYCGSGKGVRMLRKDIPTCEALVGGDKWQSVNKADEDVIIIMEIPHAGDQSYYAFPLSESGITL
ncbi:hypothetical protein F5146DRAFT_1006580 [Armillaria mellea]|nr:hypothetical protein F5146DRAFT_1006580 [Armillaria mellea]